MSEKSIFQQGFQFLEEERPSFLTGYSRHIKEKYSLEDGDCESLVSGVEKIMDSSPDKGSTKQVLVVGDIQSGKTMSYGGLISAASDNGYKLILVFTGTSNTLQKQTHTRLSQDLIHGKGYKRYWKVISDPKASTYPRFARSLKNEKTTVVVLKKNKDVLKDFSSIIDQNSIIGKERVLVIDDEADFAGLNNNESNPEGEPSTIFKKMQEIIDNFTTVFYCQYTATPQGILVLDKHNKRSPDKVVFIKPGSKYTGARKFLNEGVFREIEPAKDISFWEETKSFPKGETIPDSLQRSLVYFVIAAALIHQKDRDKVCSMMVHCSRATDNHDVVSEWINEEIRRWDKYFHEDRWSVTNQEKKYKALFENVFKENFPQKKFDSHFKIIKEEIKDLEHRIIDGRGDYKHDVDWNQVTSLILIGGEILKRGYTVKGLVVTFLTRTRAFAAKGQKDTISQWARFYGYKSDIMEYCRVFLLPRGVKDFTELAIDNDWLINRIKEIEEENLDWGKELLFIKNSPRFNFSRPGITKSRVIQLASPWMEFKNVWCRFNPEGERRSDSERGNANQKNREVYSSLFNMAKKLGRAKGRHYFAKINGDSVLKDFKKLELNEEMKQMALSILDYHKDKKFNLWFMRHNEGDAGYRRVDKSGLLFADMYVGGVNETTGDRYLDDTKNISIYFYKYLLKDENYKDLEKDVVFCMIKNPFLDAYIKLS